MQKIVDYLTWGFILLFAAPTVLIMASWNSLPGEPMFGVKRSFEQVLLFFVKPSYAAEAGLNVQYTQRRFKEAKTLLASDKSTEGLSYLSQQIKATKMVIERAPNKVKQREIAQSYITTLRTVSAELETQQAILSQTGGVPAQNQPTKKSTPGVMQPTHVPTSTPKPGGPQPTPVPTQVPEPPDPEEEVEDVQEEIENTIEDLEKLATQLDAPADDDNDKGKFEEKLEEMKEKFGDKLENKQEENEGKGKGKNN